MHQEDKENKEEDVYNPHSNNEDETLLLLDDCDPWLSRAAREILRRHLSHWTTKQTTTVWDSIDQMTSIGPGMTNDCPLHGIDVLRRHEEHSLPIPSRKLPAAYASFDRNKYGHHHDQKDPFWYQCGLCQKRFLTRFYLDRHMMLHHRQDNLLSSDNNTRRLCPAQHWCHFLVDCYDVAVEMEPYYSAGGWNEPVAFSSVQQRVPPCHEETLQTKLRACRTMVDTCFSHQEILHESLRRELCAPQMCQDRLHRILFKPSPGLSSLRHHAEWRIYGFILANALVVGFAVVYYRNYVHHRRPRSRLLQKPRRKWWCYFLYKSANGKQKAS